ncbi:MAG: response regulator, partial [Gammaproteobacteria bacterium]|nr:response regulator [Gammaproteobacteria bacterium]
DIVILLTIISTVHILYFIRRVKDAIKAIDEIASDQLTEEINTYGQNTSGVINRRIKTMQIRLGAQRNEINTVARRSQRLEAGLDNLNANIMLADQNGTITYFNASLKSYLAELSPKIIEEIPDFNLENLVGKNTGCLFNKNPDLLAAVYSITDAETHKFEFFGAQLQLQMSPIFNQQGQKLGLVIEWQDIFQELFVQDSIKALVHDANHGKLHSRLDTSQLSGFYLELSDEINGLMENLQGSLVEISTLIGSLSVKDLTVKAEGQFHGQYEWTIGNLESGIESLRESFCRVNNQASEVTQSAQHVAKSNDQLSSSIQSQAQELQKTSSAMRSLTDMVAQTSQQAQTSNELAKTTQQQVEEGNRSMEEAIIAMQEIHEVSTEITGIVGLIDSIAFQTNLLALNAAVEAARAGEHGRGFAVVAGEVRNLAQKSADAAKDIKGLINTTSQKIEQGTIKVQTTADSLNTIISQVNEMSSNIALITDNAQEQSAQIHEVNQSITMLDKAADNNSTLVLENSSLADYLGDVANSMDTLVGSFKLGDCNSATEGSDSGNESIVLVVDDNISNQKVAVLLLNKFGYTTKVASNGRDALSQCKRYNPMGILMDIEMPIMDGLEATQALRASGFKRPIIAYTGHSSDYRQTIIDAGMNDTVRKPIKPAELKQVFEAQGCKPNPNHSEAARERREKIIKTSSVAQTYVKMIEAHLGWKNKIRSLVDGRDIGVSYEAAIDHTACALGKWYYEGAGQSLMDLPLMKTLGVEHMEMHATIKMVMDAFAIDDYDTLKVGVAKIDVQSDKVVECLNELILTEE